MNAFAGKGRLSAAQQKSGGYLIFSGESVHQPEGIPAWSFAILYLLFVNYFWFIFPARRRQPNLKISCVSKTTELHSERRHLTIFRQQFQTISFSFSTKKQQNILLQWGHIIHLCPTTGHAENTNFRITPGCSFSSMKILNCQHGNTYYSGPRAFSFPLCPP